MYAQVLETGGWDNGQQNWSMALVSGTTIRHMVASNVHWSGHYERFMNGRSSEEKLTYLYRHLLAREPDDGAWGWIGVGETQGWSVVIDGILNSGEYMARFGDHIVPGDPVVAWDCNRATGLVVAHTQGFRDAGQGGASVSYTTPAYVSMDQPRSLTFTYYSGLVDPRSQMQLNLLHASADAPERTQVEVRNREGARETLTDGQLDVAFRSGQGASRISAEFREPRFTNLSAHYTAVFRKYWADGRSTEERIAFRAANLDARQSPFGYGWVLEGLQRLYDQDYGVHITEGATGLWFAQKGTAARADGTRHYSAPSGDFTTVVRDAGGTYHRSYPDGTRVRFRADGRMQNVTDRFNNVTTYEYDGEGKLVKVTDPVGKAITLGYTGGGALAWVEDPMGRRVTTETYQTALWRFRDPGETSGSVGPVALDLHFVSTPDRGLSLDSYWTAAGDRNAGLHTAYTFGYDKHGRVASVTAPQVTVTEPSGVAQVRPFVKTRSLQMSILGTGWLGNGSEVPRVRPENIRVQVINPRNDTTLMAVDPFGTPTRVEEPLGRVTRGTTDRHGRMVRAVSPLGKTEVLEYAGVELRKAYDEASGLEVQMEYEPTYHQLTHAWGTGTPEIWNYYDSQARLDSSRVGTSTSPVTKYGYTSGGRIASVTDPEGHRTEVTYEATGAQNTQTTRVPAPGGGFYTTTLVYDGAGRPVKTVLPSGDSVKTAYDAQNRVTHSTDAAGRQTVTQHNGTGMYRLTDPKGQVYSWSRNALGWVQSETDPRRLTTSFGYDRAGNQTSVTNRRNQTITFTHDALGRVRTRTTLDAGVTTYGYSPFSEPLHQWVSAQNAEGADTLVYKQNRLHDQVTWLNGRRYLVNSRYIGGSEIRDQLQVTSPFSRIIKYGYDNQMRLGSLTDIAGGTTTLGYNGDRQVSGVWLPNGISRSFTYDFTHRVKGLGFAGVASEKLAESYMYDGMGRMVQRMNNAGDTLHLYGYDAVGQLTSDQMQVKVDAGMVCEDPLRPDSCYPTTAWQNGALAQYAYDPAGNRGQADTGNRLTAFDGYSFTHDADGNLTRKWKGTDDLTMTWNSLGQMTGASHAQRGSASYGYNGFGQRVRRTAPNGAVTRYLYDGDDLLMELDGAGNPIREYTYYPGVDQPHSVRSWPNGGATYYYATDAVGHVTGLLNASGQVVNRYTYTPWGQVVSAQETVTQPLGYMARENDPVTGLYYVRARWYDAHLGRFVSEDPIGLAGGLNVYAYVGNSPLNGTDPSGLDPCTITYTYDYNIETGEIIPGSVRIIAVTGECSGIGTTAASENSPAKPTECQAMAAYANHAARHSKSFREFANKFSWQVARVNSVDDLISGSNVITGFTNGGYRPELGGTASANARHFGGHLWAAFHLSEANARILNDLRDRDLPGSDPLDHRLSLKAYELLAALSDGKLALNSAGSWIQDNVCR